jgi:hypothetical protein
MPSDMPATLAAATIPYYRTLAFVTGGAVTLGRLLLLTNLGSMYFAH